MKLFNYRYVLLVAFSVLLGACQSTPSADQLAQQQRAAAIAQLEQNLASSELATAEDELATLQAQTPDDPQWVQYQRQLAEAYLQRSQIYLQKADVNAAATALSRARTLMLGATLFPAGLSNGGTSDPTNDRTVNLPQGAASVGRAFALPAGLAPGDYDLVMALYVDLDGSGTINSGDLAVGGSRRQAVFR